MNWRTLRDGRQVCEDGPFEIVTQLMADRDERVCVLWATDLYGVRHRLGDFRTPEVAYDYVTSLLTPTQGLQ